MLHHSATAKQYCASSSTVARIRNQKVATGNSFNGQLGAGFTSVLLLVRDVISPKLAPHPLLAIPAQRNPHVNQSVATAIAKHVQMTFGRMKLECPSPFVSFLAQLGFLPSGDHGQRFGRTSGLGSLRRGRGRPHRAPRSWVEWPWFRGGLAVLARNAAPAHGFIARSLRRPRPAT